MDNFTTPGKFESVRLQVKEYLHDSLLIYVDYWTVVRLEQAYFVSLVSTTNIFEVGS